MKGYIWDFPRLGCQCIREGVKWGRRLHYPTTTHFLFEILLRFLCHCELSSLTHVLFSRWLHLLPWHPFLPMEECWVSQAGALLTLYLWQSSQTTAHSPFSLYWGKFSVLFPSSCFLCMNLLFNKQHYILFVYRNLAIVLASALPHSLFVSHPKSY